MEKRGISLELNDIGVIIRPKQMKSLYGATGGGANEFFTILSGYEFTVIPVDEQNRDYALSVLADHMRTGGGILIKVPKPQYVGQPANIVSTKLIKDPRESGVTADMWNDIPSKKLSGGVWGRFWLLSYLQRAKTHGVVHIAVTNEIKEDLIERFGVNTEKIQVIPVEIRPEFLTKKIAIDEELRRVNFGGARIKDLVIASHARIAYSKRPDRILKVARVLDDILKNSNLEDDFPDIYLSIVGNYEASEYGRHLYEEVRQSGYLGGQGKVKILMNGPIENKKLADILGQADAELALHKDSPIIRELWHMNIAEAFSLGLYLLTRSRKNEDLQRSGDMFHGSFYDFADSEEPSEEMYGQLARKIINLAGQSIYQRWERRNKIRELATNVYYPGQAIDSLRSIFQK